ncbi:hypothetical protein I4F81_004114 [Pyropia yezoensis]|uniref:Uncharacterized protein n=2 Tax=Pyropia yezoensis TaxID=2788 RepID=A0ACC3BU07_PYRYE|nr:hypothetical protein I4F81_004113 [Neopyropia yezoensis]KAK1861530.1 hypothetical protein I4F81_004114 [Neopyropia yezoensis]
MPVPTRWHAGLPDEVDFPPLAEWANLTAASTAVEVNAELERVAQSHHRDCLWRVGEARWELPVDFVDVTEADPVATYEGTRLADVHGVPAAGSPGVQSVTYMALCFANEVLRQLSRKQGIQPWVRSVFAVAAKHYDRRHSSPVHTAAMAFDRLRREWPHARVVEGEIYDGLDMMYAPTTAAMPALSALSAALRQNSSASYSETTPVDMDLSIRGGGYLKTPPLAGSKLKRRRVAAMVGGYACPVWAAWLNVHDVVQTADMVALPDLFVESGLSSPPTMPRLAEHVFSYLGDASHVAWTIVSTELVFDYASTWFRLLREQEVLVRLKRALLEVFARLPVGDLQDGSPNGYALAFHNCVVGALAFPWASVTTYVEAGGVGVAAREVAVRYAPTTSYGFTALEQLPGFPTAGEPSGSGPMRRQDGDDGAASTATAALPVVVPGAWGRHLGSLAPEFRPIVRASRSVRAAALRRGGKRAAMRLAASLAAEEGERADDRRRARAALEADQARARAKRAASAGASSDAAAGRREADRLNAGRFPRRSSSVPPSEPVEGGASVDRDVNEEKSGLAGATGVGGAQDAHGASAARAGAAARAAAVEEAERRAAAADVAARRRAAAFAEKQWREAGEFHPRRSRSRSGSRHRSRTPSGYRATPGWVRLVASDADEAAFGRIFRAEDVRRLRRMYIPAGLHNRVWCETTRVVQQALLAEVDRFHGATHVAASRGLGDAAVKAASRAVLYDRFRQALDELVRRVRGESPGRFNAHDLGH